MFRATSSTRNVNPRLLVNWHPMTWRAIRTGPYVADRSLAIAQWSQTTDSLRCSHVMMVEAGPARYCSSKCPSTHVKPSFLDLNATL